MRTKWPKYYYNWPENYNKWPQNYENENYAFRGKKGPTLILVVGPLKKYVSSLTLSLQIFFYQTF